MFFELVVNLCNNVLKGQRFYKQEVKGSVDIALYPQNASLQYLVILFSVNVSEY